MGKTMKNAHTHTHSDGRNVELEIWYVRNGSFMFQQPWSKHKMLFPLCLGRLYVDGHLGSWFMASWRGFVCGHLGGDGGATGWHVEQGWFRVGGRVSRLRMSSCKRGAKPRSAMMELWNWHFPDFREGDFLLKTLPGAGREARRFGVHGFGYRMWPVKIGPVSEFPSIDIGGAISQSTGGHDSGQDYMTKKSWRLKSPEPTKKS